MHALVLTLLAALTPFSPALALFSEDFEQPFYDEAAGLYATDHTLVRGLDGLYHLFYIVGRAGESWSVPGNEIDFGHASSPDLVHWTVHPRVIPIDPPHGWKSRNVWAPHVMVAPDGAPAPYLMAYTGVDSSLNQAIGIATSGDLFTWQDLSVAAPAYHPDPSWAEWDSGGSWSNCRDPFLARIGGEWILLATAKTRAGYLGLPGRGAIALARSDDGVTWVDSGGPLVINNSASNMESSHLTPNPITGGWHLFYTRTVAPGGVHYLTSSAPLSGWDIGTDVQLDPTAIASEVSKQETAYSSAVLLFTQDGLQRRAVRFDSLSWAGGVPEIVRANLFVPRWRLVEGTLFYEPTFHDRPAFRSGLSSNMEGRFWVHTAENYAGAYGGGCGGCGQDEKQTGVLRSAAFTLEGRRIELRVGGTASPSAYVALVDSASGEVLRQESGAGSEVMTLRTWDITALAGRRVMIEIVDGDGAGHVSVDAIREIGAPLDAGGGEPAPGRAGGRARLEAAPNPGPGWTAFSWDPEPGRPAAARLAIYDVSGRLVRLLERAPAAAGRPRLVWDGRLAGGRAAAPGVYVARLEAAGPLAAVKVILAP